MFSLSLAPGSLLFYLFLIYAFAFVVLNCFHWFIYIRISLYKENLVSKKREGLSVVICARNEYVNLKENLPAILEQDYPEFEVIVVNHSSDDDSNDLLTDLTDRFPNLKIIEIKENLNFFSGKKFPLSIGIKSATYDRIVFTDADCRPTSRNWLSCMDSSFNDSTKIILGYGAYEKRNGLLNKLIRFDTVQKSIQYFSYALAGIPYLGTGRNLAYRKSLFFNHGGFTSQYRLSSGDDDLFVNKVARKENTRIMINPESFTVSVAKKTFRHWILQKKRHISTPLYFQWKHKLMLSTFNFSLLLFYFSFIILLVMNYNTSLVLSLLIVRLFIQIFIYYKGMSKLRETDLIGWAPIFEICLLMVNFYVFIYSRFSHSDKWK